MDSLRNANLVNCIQVHFLSANGSRPATDPERVAYALDVTIRFFQQHPDTIIRFL
jgi:hypothetical protein